MVPVAVIAQFVLLEPFVVIADEPPGTPAALVEHHVVEPVQPALGSEVHFAYPLRVITSLG